MREEIYWGMAIMCSQSDPHSSVKLQNTNLSSSNNKRNLPMLVLSITPWITSSLLLYCSHKLMCFSMSIMVYSHCTVWVSARAASSAAQVRSSSKKILLCLCGKMKKKTSDEYYTFSCGYRRCYMCVMSHTHWNTVLPDKNWINRIYTYLALASARVFRDSWILPMSLLMLEISNKIGASCAVISARLFTIMVFSVCSARISWRIKTKKCQKE